MTTAVRSSGMPEALAGGLDDPQVGLVRHHHGDVVGREAGIGHGPLGRLDDDTYGPAEDLLAVHEQRAAVLALEQVLERAVGVHVPAQQRAGAVHRLDHHGARAVAHDDGDLAVVHVGDLREGLGSHEQHGARTHGDQAGHGDQPVDEARARGVEIERAALHADPVLHARRSARDDAVRSGGGQHQVVDLGGGATGLGQRGLRGLDGQTRGGAADVALADARALDDPLVARVERDRHVVVGHHLVRDGDAPAGDADSLHAADPARIPWMHTIPASP